MNDQMQIHFFFFILFAIYDDNFNFMSSLLLFYVYLHFFFASYIFPLLMDFFDILHEHIIFLLESLFSLNIPSFSNMDIAFR